MQKIIFPALVFLLFSANTFAQADENSRIKQFTADLNAYIRQTKEKIPDIPAIAVVVIKNNKPIFVQAYGIADKEKNIKADANTLFYIASSTKSFTGMAAAMLDKEGKIKLDAPLTTYSSGINLKNVIPSKITVRDLLIHTSGLKNDPLAFRMAYSGDSDPADMKRIFAEATTVVDSAYGKYDYDNLGYNIYAVLLQNTLGKKWQDLLQEKLFGPLGMKHTSAYISKAGDKHWVIAQPYIFSGELARPVHSWLDKQDNNMQSAGGIFASISDMGRWLNANMNNGKLDGKQLIAADIIQKSHTGYTKTFRDQAPFTGDGEYGLGWQIGKYNNEKVIYHHGGFPGYNSHVSFMPDQKIAVAVLINDGSIGGRTGHLLATYIYDWWLKADSITEAYAKKLQDLTDGYDKGKQSMTASAADRTKRVSQLSMPLQDYAGKYNHPQFGMIEVRVKDSGLLVSMGNMHYVATPFREKESIRVELIPGTGEPIFFKKNAENIIESLKYSGAEFMREK